MQIESTTVLASRYWGANELDLERLAVFIRHSHTLPVRAVAIAINDQKDLSLARLNLERKLFPGTFASYSVFLLPMREWNGVTPALNCLLDVVAEHWPAVSKICFLSVEVLPTYFQFQSLVAKVEEGAFVAGAVMAGHSPDKGLAARTPWNTFAVWDFQRLRMIGGFPSIADKVEPAGMEEVGAIIQSQQSFMESETKVLLLHFKGGVNWRSVPSGPRLVRHICKMNSKDRRASAIAHSFGVEQKLPYKTEWLSIPPQ